MKTDGKNTASLAKFGRQLQIVETMFQNDVTLKAACKMHGISTETGNKHIKRLKRAVGCKTTHGIAVFLFRCGYLKP